MISMHGACCVDLRLTDLRVIEVTHFCSAPFSIWNHGRKSIDTVDGCPRNPAETQLVRLGTFAH